jgi:hypothetical protein
MREPDDAPPVFGDLHRHAFAHAAEAAELVLRQQLEIPAHRLAGLSKRAVGRHCGSVVGIQKTSLP